MLNVHHFIDSKVQTYINVLNSRSSIYTAWVLSRRHRDGGVATADRLLQTGRFELSQEGDNSCSIGYIVVMAIPNLRGIEGKTNFKVFDL